MSPTDLNALPADTPWTFLREYKTQLDLVFQKMSGNTIFVLEFLRLLAESGLLEYNARKCCWAWGKDHIDDVDMTANTIHLFSSKRSRLLETTQSALKVVVCFGVINELVIGYLSNTVMS